MHSNEHITVKTEVLRTLTQVGLSELQLHYQTMCKQVDQKKCYNQGSYYRNATSAAALVNPLIVRAIEVLHVQLQF